MTSIDWVVLNLAYIIGLLLTALPRTVNGIDVGAIALLLVGLIAALVIPRIWRVGPKRGIWLSAGIVGCFAILQFHFQMPHPSGNDVSTLVVGSSEPASQLTQVEGYIETPPRLTRSQRIQFQLRARQAALVDGDNEIALKPVEGKLYVTVPLLQGTGLYPGQPVIVTGTIYRPKPAANPGGFNFQAYLEQEGIFSGLSGQRVDFPAVNEQSQPFAGKVQRQLWKIRKLIVRSQVSRLGVPEGPLVSAMLLGGNAVDVPYSLRDSFAQVGLAHAIAASGFQVSALIGIVVALTQSLSNRIRFPLSISILVIYIGLTGFEPSVLRAGVMGVAALIALTLERKVRPLGSFLLAATILLLFKPVWIWDLGFQLSFLATLGLLITVPVLTKQLDWVPTAIAPLIAVPIAAYMWTLPLQLFKFGVVSPYSIPINIIAAPFITIISIGSGISALLSLILPQLGSAASGLLFYPTHWLITLVDIVGQLPGNAFAIGTISVSQVIVLYGLYGLVWWQNQTRWQRYKWIVGVVCISLVMIPALHAYASTTQITILATSEHSTVVIQSKGHVILISDEDEEDANYITLPFLRGQGINSVDLAIAPNLQFLSTSGWFRTLKYISIRSFLSGIDLQQLAKNNVPEAVSNNSKPNNDELKNSFLAQTILNALDKKRGHHSLLTEDQILSAGSVQAQVVSVAPFVLHLKEREQSWLILQDLSPEDQQALINSKRIPAAEVVWWAGEELSTQTLEAIQPAVAITSAKTIDPKTATWLQHHQTTVYSTIQDGSIQWEPKQGFTTTLTSEEG